MRWWIFRFFWVLICKHFKVQENNVKCSIQISYGLQFSSVAQSCPTLCDPMDRSTSCFPVHHQLPKLAQTHVYQVGDAIQLKGCCWAMKDAGILGLQRRELNPGLVMRLDCSELLCNKVLLKYKRDRQSFWHRHQKGAERVPPC